jgi:hypothetical protein
MSLRYNQATLVYVAGMVVAGAWRSTWPTALLRWQFARLTSDLSYCPYRIGARFPPVFRAPGPFAKRYLTDIPGRGKIIYATQ